MTIRTHAELLALYADNVTGDISAENLRDLVDTHFAPRIERVHATLFAEQSGGSKPSPGTIGASSYWGFSVGDELWMHATIPANIDDTQDIVIHVDWAPPLGETTRTVSWQVEYLLGNATFLISDIDGTLTSVDDAVPVINWENSGSTFTIPAAVITAADHEVHLKLTRLVSTNDPANIAVHHVWCAIVIVP